MTTTKHHPPATRFDGFLANKLEKKECEFFLWREKNSKSKSPLRPRVFNSFKDALLAARKRKSRTCQVSVVFSLNEEEYAECLQRLDDDYWVERAEEGEAKGDWLSEEESEAFMQEVLGAEPY